MEPSKKARREMQADYNDVESLSYLLNSLKLEVEMLSESGKTTINHLPKICKGQEEHTFAGFREINEDDTNDLSESSEEDEDDINQKHNETMFNLAVTQVYTYNRYQYYHSNFYVV